MKTRLHFFRFEFKYILPEALRQDVESDLLYFMELDPYVARQPGHVYFVRSLYYDNKAMTCYYEKIDGMMHREKFRVRTYADSEEAGAAAFLEVKGRHNALVFKHRVELAAAGSYSGQASPVHTHETTREVLGRLPEGVLKERFLGDLHRKRLVPIMGIDYQRRPYISKFDPEFRVTFDGNLSCAPTARLFPRLYESRRRILPGYTILEIKFQYHVPKWFHRLIQSFELRRVSISKYCAGVEAYNLAEKLE